MVFGGGCGRGGGGGVCERKSHTTQRSFWTKGSTAAGGSKGRKRGLPESGRQIGRNSSTAEINGSLPKRSITAKREKQRRGRKTFRLAWREGTNNAGARGEKKRSQVQGNLWSSGEQIVAKSKRVKTGGNRNKKRRGGWGGDTSEALGL